jgi:hypothetical protein
MSRFSAELILFLTLGVVLLLSCVWSGWAGAGAYQGRHAGLPLPLWMELILLLLLVVVATGLTEWV